MDTVVLDTEYGSFTTSYHETKEGQCIALHQGDLTKGPVILRIHSSCLFGEAFHSKDCDCSDQLHEALKLINKEKKGVLIYLYDEGRGQGIENKIKSMGLEQKLNIDTAEAFKMLGLELDKRKFLPAIKALKDLNVAKDIFLISNNYRKENALKKAGYNVLKTIELDYPKNEKVKRYLKSKVTKLGHKITKL